MKGVIQWSAVTVTPSGINKSVTVTNSDCHCNSSYKMTHIEAKSINPVGSLKFVNNLVVDLKNWEI